MDFARDAREIPRVYGRFFEGRFAFVTASLDTLRSVASNNDRLYLFVFGEDPKTGRVDVANIDGSVAENITRDEAEQLIKQRDSDLEILAFVRGEGKFSHYGKGITTYPERNDDKHSALLRLESLGVVRRHNESDHAVVWMPVE